MDKIKKFAKEFRLEITFFLVVFIMLFIGAGSFPFLDPDSYQWLEKSFEIVRKGNWLTHSQWFGKPPLIIWLTALSAKIFGISLFSLKVMNLLISWFSVLFVYLLAKEVFGGKTALWSAIIYAVSPSFAFLKFSHKMDVPVVLFMTAALYFFYVYKRTGKPSNIYFFWTSCFAGFMVKSAYSFYPVFLIPTAAVLSKDQEILKTIKQHTLHHVLAIMTMLLIIAPWYIGQFLTHGTKFVKFQYVEHLGRFFFKSGALGARDNNVHAYPINTILVMLPWSVFIGPALTTAWKKIKGSFDFQLLFWWFLPPLIAFSLSGELKVVRYLMFIFPALSMLIASYFENMEETKKLKLWLASASAVLLGLAVTAIVLTSRSADAFTRELVPFVGPFLMIFFLGMVAFSAFFYLKGKKALSFLVLTTSTALIVLVTMAFSYLPIFYPRMIAGKELAKRITMNKPVFVMDMEFKDYIYIKNRLVLIEDIGIDNVKPGDYVASSSEYSVVSEKLGKKVSLIFAKDVKYKSGRATLPYRLFRVK